MEPPPNKRITLLLVNSEASSAFFLCPLASPSQLWASLNLEEPKVVDAATNVSGEDVTHEQEETPGRVCPVRA